jgi:hypothetical protein
MKIEPKRSQIQDKILTPRLGLALLLLVLLTISIASAAAQGSSSGTPFEELGEDLVLRRVKTPTSDIIDLLPIQDTYITSNRPDQNYGQAADFWVGYDLDRTGGGAERPYIQWDIGQVPEYITINSAELWYYIYSVRPGGDAAMATNVRHLLDSWSGDTLTWNNAQNVDWGSIAVEGEVPGSVGWRSLDATDLVKDWTSGGHENHGLVVLGDESVQERERGIYTRNASIDLRPFLRIDYSITNDTIPPTASMLPFPEPIIGHSDFSVSWTGEDNPGGTGIDYFDVQFDADGDGLGWINWLLHTTNTTATFVGESTAYQFRVRATDRAGNLSDWSDPESITVDTAPPESTVLPFDPPIIQTDTFQVEWTGDDGPNGSGIQYFNVYSRRGNGSWVLWLSQTTFTVELFTAPNDASYSFEATAVDNLGNAETQTGVPEASIIVDIDPPFVEPYAVLPLIFKDAN